MKHARRGYRRNGCGARELYPGCRRDIDVDRCPGHAAGFFERGGCIGMYSAELRLSPARAR